MDLDFTALKSSIRYKLLTALVIPRPIAWISTCNESGTVNVAPFSFFNVLGNDPPIVGVGFGRRPDGSEKDTLRNIKRSGDFVVNLVDREMAQAMHESAAPYLPGTSEVEELALGTADSYSVSTPRISDCKASLECTLHQTLEIGSNRIVLGVVKHLHLVDGLVDPETYRIGASPFEGIGRLQGPGWYCTTNDRFDQGGFPSILESKKD